MDIEKDKIRKLDEDELEMVTGGKTFDFFRESRLARIFSDGTVPQDENETPLPGTNRPPIMKA